MLKKNYDRSWLNQRRKSAEKAKVLFHNMPKGSKVWRMAGKLYLNILKDIRKLENKG